MPGHARTRSNAASGATRSDTLAALPRIDCSRARGLRRGSMKAPAGSDARRARRAAVPGSPSGSPRSPGRCTLTQAPAPPQFQRPQPARRRTPRNSARFRLVEPIRRASRVKRAAGSCPRTIHARSRVVSARTGRRTARRRAACLAGRALARTPRGPRRRIRRACCALRPLPSRDALLRRRAAVDFDAAVGGATDRRGAFGCSPNFARASIAGIARPWIWAAGTPRGRRIHEARGSAWQLDHPHARGRREAEQVVAGARVLAQRR